MMSRFRRYIPIRPFKCRSYDPSAKARAMICWVKLLEPKSWFPLEAQDRGDQARREDAEPELDPWAEGLAERPGVDHGFPLGVVPPNARRLVALEVQAAVGRVFEDVDRVPLRPAPGQRDQRPPTVFSQADPARVRVFRDGVDHLDPTEFAPSFQVRQGGFENVEPHPSFVDRDADHPRPPGFQDAEEDEVGGGLDQDDVARVDQGFSDEVEQLR